jgi:hypothetical protein
MGPMILISQKFRNEYADLRIIAVRNEGKFALD